MTITEDREIVQSRTDTTDKLLQLAEEATELSHAAIKLLRVRKGTNPSPVSIKAAKDNLQEEVADVLTCLLALDSINDSLQPNDAIAGIAVIKMHRWAWRLLQEIRQPQADVHIDI